MKAAALRGALSDRLSHGRIAVVSAFVEGEEPSTKDAFSVLCTAIGVTVSRLSRPVLVVVSEDDELSRKSLRNVPGARVLDSGQLNTYDVLASDHVVFTEPALGEFVGRVTGAELTVVESPAKPARAKKASTAKAKADEAKADATADETEAEASVDETAAAAVDEAPAKPARASRAKKPAAAEAAVEADEPAAATDEASAGEPEADEPAAKPNRASRARKPKEEQE
jgi:hypothetical protein